MHKVSVSGMGTAGLCTSFDTEKYFLVYWEDGDCVAKSSDVKDVIAYSKNQDQRKHNYIDY